jgi:hypothetical protein
MANPNAAANTNLNMVNPNVNPNFRGSMHTSVHQPSYSYLSSYSSGGYGSQGYSVPPTIPLPATPRRTVLIGVDDNYFEPPTLRIRPGTTVLWRNDGRHLHSITAYDGGWDMDLPPRSTFYVTFYQPGTYYYYCKFHKSNRMIGAIIVSTGTDNGTYSMGY